MANLREISTENQWEIVRIKAVLTPFPVRFEFPIEARDNIPKSVIKAIEGVRVLRFFTPALKDDVISFRGYLWSVVGKFHEPQVRGSNNADQLPIVLTAFIGPV